MRAQGRVEEGNNYAKIMRMKRVTTGPRTRRRARGWLGEPVVVAHGFSPINRSTGTDLACRASPSGELDTRKSTPPYTINNMAPVSWGQTVLGQSNAAEEAPHAIGLISG